ncbi:alpha/beta hydrolase [Aeoliella mucimassa]|uniref:Alpha/beta hydrolase family protein n=1 Tax=Aeoliella mucimassa TaxID=2527972 RepID=A0A518AIW2_9BACT|nr:alpha/beta hydrolase [Aeoliella mucimassa]QDU54678.1 Alpha/beta hydrolase family protein [Aeoliella mucimassa]
MSLKSKLATIGWRIGRLVLIAYLLVVLLMTFLETWLVYPAPSAEEGDWTAALYEHEDVWIESAGDVKLHGWLFEHPNPKHYLLYCHGNGELVCHNADLMNFLRDDLEATVLIFDYRGYGKSEGSPYEAGVVADGQAAHRWLADYAGIETNQVVVMGCSLGGGVAVASAAELGAKALVLQSTFGRMVDTAAKLHPWLPVRLVMKNRYDSIGRIANYNGPLLQSHGTEDDLIPIEQGRQLFDASKATQKEWYEYSGGHTSGVPITYYPVLKRFLNGLAAPESEP